MSWLGQCKYTPPIDNNEDRKKYIQTIISANNDNSLAIFVGAGISKSSETTSVKLPSLNDLIEDLKIDLEIENESDYLKIAQLYYLAFVIAPKTEISKEHL